MANKETVGLKLDPEIAQKFKDNQKEYKTAQEFVEILLNTHLEKQIETDTDSPVHQEKMRVRKALADVDRVVSAFLEIASNDKTKAIQEAVQKTATAQAEVIDLKEQDKAHQEAFTSIEAKATEQEKTITSLRESAESVHALKDAWSTEKRNLTTRIAELDTEAQEARKLKAQIVETEKALAGKEKELAEFQAKFNLAEQQYKNKLSLSEQQHNNDESIIKDLKQQTTEQKTLLQSAQDEHKEFIISLKAEYKETTIDNKQSLSELQKELKQARADLTTAQDALNSEKLTNAQKELQLEKDFATEKEKLLAQVGTTKKKKS